jgi:hypothetical protein
MKRHRPVLACAALAAALLGPPAAWGATAPLPPPAPELSADVVAAVAAAYYARPDGPPAPSKAPAKGGAAAGADLAGLVTDRRGRPVAGARVVAEVERGAPSLETTTDADGRYRVPAPGLGDGVSLTVTAPGFERWSVSTVRATDGSVDVRLDRALDDGLWRDLAAAADPAERLWLALEVVGARTMGAVEAPAVFAHLGALRAELRAVAQSTAFARPDDRIFSPRGRALSLLAAWGDPADAALVAPWRAETRGVLPLPTQTRAATIGAVCALWADDHFRREKVETRTWHACDEPVLSADGARALTEFRVRYAHWGYSQLLFLVKESEGWRLHLARDHVTEHYD